MSTDMKAPRDGALSAYAQLSREAGLAPELPASEVELSEALSKIQPGHAASVAAVRAFLRDSGFAELSQAVAAFGRGHGRRPASAGAEQAVKRLGGPAPASAGAMRVDPQRVAEHLDNPEVRLVPRADGTVRPLVDLSAFASMKDAFSAPLPQRGEFPKTIGALVDDLAAWSQRVANSLARMPRASATRQTVDIGVMISDALALLRRVNTLALDAWMNDERTPAAAKQQLEAWRVAFYARCDALSLLSAEALVSTNLVTPDHSVVRTLVGNTRKLSELLGAKSYLWGGIGLWVGMGCLAIRERRFLGAVLGRQLRMKGLTFSRLRGERQVKRANGAAGTPLLTSRHAEVARTAFERLEERGVTGARADAIVGEALRGGEVASGKPWKGLTVLIDLLVYAGADPKAPEFQSVLQHAMHDPIHYTYSPGAEWTVRDYEIGRELLKHDGRESPEHGTPLLQQGRNSLSPGYMRAGHLKSAIADHYFAPVQMFLDSMVTADGADHRRHRLAFTSLFSTAAVQAQVPFIEATVSTL